MRFQAVFYILLSFFVAFPSWAIPVTGSPPEEDKIRELMSQPVSATLRSMNQLPISDINHDNKLRSSRKPVLIIYYNDIGIGSKGLAAIYYSIQEAFKDSINFYSFMIGKGAFSPSDFSISDFEQKYGVKVIPSMLFYYVDKKNKLAKVNVQGGFDSLEKIQQTIVQLINIIEGEARRVE